MTITAVDMRWLQPLKNYERALSLAAERALSELEERKLIKPLS